MKWLVFFLWVFSYQAFSQETTETRELIGNLGGRAALINLYVTSLPDGSARLTGEYLVLPTLQRRFLEGERSKQLGVTFLKEGPSPILYGRPPEATLQGTYAGGVFKGTRYGPAGQERERFEFSESFASMDGYGANVHCETSRRALCLDTGLRGRKRQAEKHRVALHGVAGGPSLRHFRARAAGFQRRPAVCRRTLQRHAARPGRIRAGERPGLRRDVRLAGLSRAGAGRPQRRLPAVAAAIEVEMRIAP